MDKGLIRMRSETIQAVTANDLPCPRVGKVCACALSRAGCQVVLQVAASRCYRPGMEKVGFFVLATTKHHCRRTQRQGRPRFMLQNSCSYLGSQAEESPTPTSDDCTDKILWGRRK